MMRIIMSIILKMTYIIMAPQGIWRVIWFKMYIGWMFGILRKRMRGQENEK